MDTRAPEQPGPAAAPPGPAKARHGLELGHVFADPLLLRQALTHRSAGSQAPSVPGRRRPRGAAPDPAPAGSNERLEFLGDRVLGLLIAEWLVARHPHETEGDLGKRLARLVAQPTLVEVARRIGLAEALIVPAAESRAGVRARASVLADAMEAVIAALYLDGGLPAARAFVRRHFAEAVEALARPPVPAKTRLQEWLQGRGHALPRYSVAAAAGPAHAPRFTVLAEAEGLSAEASGQTKRAAEEEAAARLLAALEARA